MKFLGPYTINEAVGEIHPRVAGFVNISRRVVKLSTTTNDSIKHKAAHKPLIAAQKKVEKDLVKMNLKPGKSKFVMSKSVNNGVTVHTLEIEFPKADISDMQNARNVVAKHTFTMAAPDEL